MLKQQTELLAAVRKAEADARKLYAAGVNIAGVIQKLKAAGNELQTRVTYLKREQDKPADKPAAPEIVVGNDTPSGKP